MKDDQGFKIVPSFLKDLESLTRPEIRLPMREDDCPAAPVCEAVGNLRKGCTAGSSFLMAQAGSEKCVASLILLISRLTGMWPKEMVEEIERSRQPIGFSAAPSSDPDPEKGGESTA